MGSSNKVIIIDNGSYECRVGFNDSELPELQFRNLVAKPRKDKRKEMNAVTPNENIFQIGDEVDVDAMRLLIKNQFERNVMIHPIYQEHILDYIFNKLIPNACDDYLNYPILMTEPLANPNYCRQTMNELLFECYNAPGVCYGIDSMFSWQHSIWNQNIQNKTDALILSLGYHTTHVIPVLNGNLQHDKVRRLNLGGHQMINFLMRLLQMKYPVHMNAITLTRMENILHTHSSISLDYKEELKQWDNLTYYDTNVKKIQLPYVQSPVVNTISIEEKLKKKKELAKRLIEANRKRLKEKREEGGQDSPSKVCNRVRSTKTYQPPENIPLEEWLNDIQKKQEQLLEKKSLRIKKRQEMVKRHTLASQERMRIISLLASNEKGLDEFGKDDKDWDVYKQISHENESDSEVENEKLQEYENILKHHQHVIDDHTINNENMAEFYQLHIGVESIRVPELLFQPSMIGISEAGLAELINFVFNLFPASDQQILADNIFLTGGCSQFPGILDRLVKEIREMRPFQSSFSIRNFPNSSLSAWLGARDFANLSNFMDNITTKQDYDEYGKDYFKEYATSNKHFTTQKY